MRDLLFLAHRIPYPPSKGDKSRAWQFLRHLTATRRVHLGCFIDNEEDWTHVPFLKTLCGETCFVPLRRAKALARSLPALATNQALTMPYYYDRGMTAWVGQRRRDQPVTAFVYSSSMAQYVMDAPETPRIIDFVDVDSEKWRDYAVRRRWPLAALYRREGEALLAAERRIAREFDASIFVSEAEANLFRGRAPESADRVHSIRMGVDLERFSRHGDFADPYNGGRDSALCFTGMMNYWPNVDAVTWFVEAVFPQVRAIRPSASFWIVGAHPTRSVEKLAAHPGVFVTGRVPDTRPYLAHAAAVVAPLRVARGIQTKVLEAMAMGRPVIASDDAFQGLQFEANRDLIVARTAEEFVRSVNRVWNHDWATALGQRARRAVEQNYDWSQPLASLDDVLGSVEARAAERSPVVVPGRQVIESAPEKLSGIGQA